MILASLQNIGGTIDQEFRHNGYSCQLSFGIEIKRAANNFSGALPAKVTTYNFDEAKLKKFDYRNSH